MGHLSVKYADKLADDSFNLSIPFSSALTFLELCSLKKSEIWQSGESPTHPWYSGKKPSSALDNLCNRTSWTALSSLASRHINCLSFIEGKKVFTTCLKCLVHQASSWAPVGLCKLSKQDIYCCLLPVLDFLRTNSIMDFACFCQALDSK